MFLLKRGHRFTFGILLLLLMPKDGICNKTDVIYYTKENSTAVLECPFKSVSGSITWMTSKNYLSEILAVGKTVRPGIENIKVVGNYTSGEYNLELQRVTKADEKIYKCILNNTENLHEFELSMRLSTSNDEIQILNVTETNTVVGFIGISLTLKCISKPRTVNSILWSTNGKILCESQENVSAYEFIPKETNQNAIYTCTAFYFGKKIRKSVRLNLVEIRYFTTLETIEADQAGYSEKNHVIVTIVAIIIVSAVISICVYFFRNKGSENDIKLKDLNMVQQESQPGAQENVQQYQNSAGLVNIKVDFELKQKKNGPKLFSIHSSNNRTPYADIDFSAKADPLPESESDDNGSEEDDFFTLEDVQG